MPTTDKKVIFYAPPDIQQWLAEEQSRTGAPISEICRRALRLAAFGEAQATREAGYMRARKSLEDYEAKQRPTTPVLFVQKTEPRDAD